MEKVYGQLFGNPQIFLDGEPVFFSFSKINALLFYLFVNKKVSRDEIATLLWPNMSEKNAKKNLRNTIYQANKSLGGDYISSPNKVLLVLNEELSISSDVEKFNADPTSHLSLYQDTFLKGFYLKESEEFDNWTIKMASYYEKKFMTDCYRKVEHDIQVGEFDDVENNLNRLIQLDEFDERNYQLLMDYYQKIERHEKVIEIYYKLTDLLNNELGIEPSRNTIAFYERSIEIVNNQNKQLNRRFPNFFFGRQEEIQQMEMQFNRFLHNDHFQSIVIKGEAGVGKISLCRRVLDNVQKYFFILETDCYQVEQQYELRPWRKILRQLSEIIEEYEIIKPVHWQTVIQQFFPNFDREEVAEDSSVGVHVDLNLFSQVVIEAIRKISEIKKIVINITDIQWMDEVSFRLLTSVILHLKKNEAMFLFTLRNEVNSAVYDFFSTINIYDLLLEIDLAPLTKKETREFILNEQPESQDIETLTDRLYSLTEGNFFFLTESLHALRNNRDLDVMTLKMQDAIRNRFVDLTVQEKQIVEIVSYFYDYVSMDTISTLLKTSAFDLVQSTDSLINQGVLKEDILNDEVIFSFTHKRLREFAYENQTKSKKIITHKEIAKILENSIKTKNKDTILYANIAYHYEEAREWLKALNYRLLFLQEYFRFYHELFPVIEGLEDREYANLEHLRKGTEKELKKVYTQLMKLEDMYKNNPLFQKLLVQYYIIEGRYHIQQGNYKKGVEDARLVIVKAKELDESEFLLEGYKQMIYFCIQIDDAPEMSHYVELALNEAIQNNNHESIGMLLRLKGLYYLMVGEFDQSMQQLNKSINTFTITEEIRQKYAVNIAAAYDYLAEISSIRGDYDEAVQLQNKAIELCEPKKAYSSLSIFYINMGIILFGKEEYEEAKGYFMKAYEIYEEFSSLWKRPQLDAYMSLINLYQKNYQAVFVYLISSKKYMEQFENPRDKGTIYFAEAMIKHQLVQENHHDHKLWEMLDQDELYYYRKAMEYLSPNRDKLETNLLKETFEPLI